MDKIDIIYLIIFSIIGYVISLLIHHKYLNIAIMEPTLDNYHNILYIDENNVCYKYRPIETPCI
ncbi:MAG: hypothetical protein Faunusvirus6_11 [Faunusvirus sp.]|jgi:hypothetical protein|uniref:Uncharacterized protein n=1 Tax=Faunusvirus sp. TaxID=2487766 RepID=A0A3G5A071_9VIRU|nr:MAG: hypothetical protein Faunusvirus6_11 [Faunusvirus sp.]